MYGRKWRHGRRDSDLIDVCPFFRSAGKQGFVQQIVWRRRRRIVTTQPGRRTVWTALSRKYGRCGSRCLQSERAAVTAAQRCSAAGIPRAREALLRRLASPRAPGASFAHERCGQMHPDRYDDHPRARSIVKQPVTDSRRTTPRRRRSRNPRSPRAARLWTTPLTTDSARIPARPCGCPRSVCP